MNRRTLLTRLVAMDRFRPRACLVLHLGLSLLAVPFPTRAGLETYDAVIVEDQAAGLTPLARLTQAVTFNGSNRASFDFGPSADNVSMEFILEGDPVAGGLDAYLAVGANPSSNLRYEQWSDTGQLGFTQLGEVDYLFSPSVPSPRDPTHIVYAWNAAARTMTLYWNGSVAGTRSAVSANFAMPAGSGYLGANPSNTESMVGTIHRLTVYNELLSDTAIQRHSDAFNDVVRPPVIASFTADPEAVFVPGSVTLSWVVQKADALFLNGTEVTGLLSVTLSPTTTTTYVLTATNAAAAVSAQITVPVDPPPLIDQFHSSKRYLVPGETVTLSWQVRYAQTCVITPEPGDVSGITLDGAGATFATPAAPTTYELAASNAFGTTLAHIDFHLLQPAHHLVISEFMANDDSTWPDEDGDYSGWIEIYNPTAETVQLDGHFLTDDAENPTRWAFPDVALAAGARRVVFASGKDRRDPAGPLHTSFELRNSGEYLALVGPGPHLLHAFSPTYPPQRTDLSYGILGADPATERYFGLPTPGLPNDETLAPPFPVELSQPGGFFTVPFEVTLSSVSAPVQIRFTLDGSQPGLTHGAVYHEPIPITGTTHLRAVAIDEGGVSPLAGAGYVKLGPDLTGYTSSLPILVIENFGAGTIPQKGWTGNGSGLRQVPRQPAIWATFDRADGASSFQDPPQMFSHIGIRGRGAYSTQWRQKPYSVEAVDEQGQEVDVAPLALPPHSDWVLYFPDPDDNKDPTLLFNTFAYELSALTGQYAVRFRWVEAFVNEDGGDLSLADRRGVYVLIEKVSRGPDRLDFQRLSPDGTTGGWLLNLNRMDPEPETGWPAPNGATQPWFFHTAGPNRLQETPPNTIGQGDDIPRQINGFLNFDNPNGYTLNAAQRAAIENWFRQFEDVLYNDLLWRDPTLGYRRYLDEQEFADYFVLNVLTRNGDGLLISLFPWKGDDGQLRIGPAWDYNWSAYYISGSDPTGSLMHRSDRLWYARLFQDPDFLQLYIDRWWDLRRGPLRHEAMAALVDAQAADISPEKALLNGLPSPEEWTQRLTRMKSWLQARADWIDGNYLAPPLFNLPGGPVPDGFQLVMTGPQGTLYFTLDGSDPRAPGGTVAASAQAYQDPIPLTTQTTVLARVKNGSQWSGLTRAAFYPPQDLSPLAVTEVMYHPPPFQTWEGSELEFLELKNTGTQTLNLGSLTFTHGIEFTFTHGTRLGPGQFFVLARNPAAFQAKYPGLSPHGLYTGKLDNNGERLRLATLFGSTIFSLTYNNRAPWPLPADGFGFSAVPRPPLTTPNADNGSLWRSSALPGGSPGADDPESNLAPILIHEILTHTDPPALDAVELYNPTPPDVDLGGWFLSDDPAVPCKFRFPPGTIIPGQGYLVLTEDDFNPQPDTLLNFSLNSAGDNLYLVSGDDAGNLTGYSHGVSFGAAAHGVSFGRHLNSVGEEQFPPQSSLTLGGPNAGPAIGPVVIQEIMYHPNPTHDEFVELRNLMDIELPLFDPDHPTNTWRLNGLGYPLPPGILLPAQGRLLLVGTDPVAFRSRHGVPPEVPILGPWPGMLQDSGERLSLQRPDTPDTNGVAYLTVDTVRYNDKAPWPPGADGGGASLQRVAPTVYADDPAHWIAAQPTPGQDFIPGQKPVLTRQPQSQTIVAYQPVVFSVTATGPGPLFYQWLWNGAPLPGATNNTLSLASVLPDQAGSYQAVIFNAAGSVSSLPALLTTLLPPLILLPPADVTTNSGGTATFSVLALGTGPLHYQWQFNGAALPQATNATFTLTDVQAAHDGLYAVVVTDDIGPMTSPPARLTVLLRPAFVVHPPSLSVPVGTPAVLSVTTTGTLPIGYRWRRGFATVTNMLLSSHVSFLTLPRVQSTDAGSYTVVATNIAFSSPGVLSLAASLTVLDDTDGDRMPDAWELTHNLDPHNPADADEDTDGDGMNNGEEYVAGTHPLDPASYLKVERVLPQGPVTLEFLAASNKTYTVEFTENLNGAPWTKLHDVAHQPNTRLEIVRDPNPTTPRFYRLVTPRQP